MLDCITFGDKIIILRKTTELKGKLPYLQSHFCKEAEKLRNNLAHPVGYQESAILMEREKLVPFIEWAEELKFQLMYSHRSVEQVTEDLNKKKAESGNNYR
ncbi:MAG: hypothetical protein HXX08_23600 [Chloroflexi bacterium]|uniref:Uncharacterized protein n=1 Tax=Candidatus Chlorohelix allophototropha TaxID=3003348 RepID=A0A8T7MA02_9CHLR|nr:hypothetical protein [Chloroflexota bacterium]WJW68788.1 hypothetical protein OZ401_004405 [Chloroflexota bacterium L227-S17]